MHIELDEALASGDLILPQSYLSGFQQVNITYLGISGIISVFYVDLYNLQIEVYTSDISRDNDKIYINTDGEITVVDSLESSFWMDNEESYTGYNAPPLEYLFGIDLSSPGRQEVTIYTSYRIFTLYVVVYEGDIPPQYYEIIIPLYIPVGAGTLEGEINYYQNRALYENNEILYTDTINDISNLDTSI